MEVFCKISHNYYRVEINGDLDRSRLYFFLGRGVKGEWKRVAVIFSLFCRSVFKPGRKPGRRDDGGMTLLELMSVLAIFESLEV